MTRGLLAAVLLCVSAAAAACPICLGAGQPSKAQQLVAAQQAVLAVPTADASRFRVIEVIKGERPAGSTIEGGYPRSGPAADAVAPKGKPLLLVRTDPFPTWVILGAIGAEQSGWLRKLAAGKRVGGHERGGLARPRRAGRCPISRIAEPLVAELAYGELAAAPYAALRTAKPHLDARRDSRVAGGPELAARQPLYLLLLGICRQRAGRRRPRAAPGSGVEIGRCDEPGLDAGRGPASCAARRAWRGSKRNICATACARRGRSTAALLALSVHGNANGVIPRERVIQSYRMFMKEHPEIAGYVAPGPCGLAVLGRGARSTWR